MDDGMAIDVVDGNHEAILEFLLRCDTGCGGAPGAILLGLGLGRQGTRFSTIDGKSGIRFLHRIPIFSN
jgi:hypothetical protein